MMKYDDGREAARGFDDALATAVGAAYDAISVSTEAEKTIGPMPAILRACDELREITKSLERTHRDWHLQYCRAGFEEDPDAPPRPLDMPWLRETAEESR